MTPEQLSKLKDGDIVRNMTGNAYTVLRNLGDVVIAARTTEIRNAPEWEVVQSTRWTVKTTAPDGIGLVSVITTLQALGWTFNELANLWTSPDGSFRTEVLRSAWKSRNDFPKRAERPMFFFESQLRVAGWKNICGTVWLSPSGKYFDDIITAYTAMTS